MGFEPMTSAIPVQCSTNRSRLNFFRGYVFKGLVTTTKKAVLTGHIRNDLLLKQYV